MTNSLNEDENSSFIFGEMMKKYFLCLFLGVLTVAELRSEEPLASFQENLPVFPEQDEYDYYAKGGVSYFYLPTIGMGMRSASGHHGFDLSISSCFFVTSGKGLYQYWFNPLHKGWYLGIGGGMNYATFPIWGNDWVAVIYPALEQSFGYQWKGESHAIFLQFELSDLIVGFGRFTIIPIPGLTCGIKF